MTDVIILLKGVTCNKLLELALHKYGISVDKPLYYKVPMFKHKKVIHMFPSVSVL